MTKQLSEQPIGIFDSGIGGLTVANALVKQLPKEDFIYFGDTAHLPYGEKSVAAIQSYSVKIAELLLQKNCKLILIACSTASTVAFDLVREYVGEKAHVMNMVDPTVHLLQERYAQKRIGLIATRGTVNSTVYKKKIEALNRNIDLTSLATNLLASAIEEFGNHKVIDGLLEEYLSNASLENIEALVLACTHYPVIKDKIATFFNHAIDIIDPSDAVANAVRVYLEKTKLLNTTGGSSKHFYISDYTPSFATGAKKFFADSITLEHYPLWD